jgi:hypothetical protein
MAEESSPPSPMISGHVVTAHEFMLWQTLRTGSPVGRWNIDEITSLVELTGLTKEEVLVALGGLLGQGLVKRLGGATREWFLALPDLTALS